MAKRNRRKKKENAAVVMPWAALLMVVAVLTLMYVWLDSRGQVLGTRIKDLERQIGEVKKRADHESWKWNALKSPANIERQLEKHGIAMIWPDEENVVRLSTGNARLSGSQMASLSSSLYVHLND